MLPTIRAHLVFVCGIREIRSDVNNLKLNYQIRPLVISILSLEISLWTLNCNPRFPMSVEDMVMLVFWFI